MCIISKFVNKVIDPGGLVVRKNPVLYAKSGAFYIITVKIIRNSEDNYYFWFFCPMSEFKMRFLLRIAHKKYLNLECTPLDNSVKSLVPRIDHQLEHSLVCWVICVLQVKK